MKNAGLLLIVIPLMLLGGCAANAQTAASGGTSSPSASATAPDPLVQLANFTITDLQAADADAVAHNDALAHACYPALIQFVQGLPNPSSLTVSGAFSAFQKARDLKGALNAGVPNYLLIGCGPLYAQVHGDLLRFLGGAAVAPLLAPGG